MAKKTGKTVTFLGREYDLEKLLAASTSSSPKTPLLTITRWPDEYEASASGPIYNLMVDGSSRRSAQQAVTALEKKVLREFKKIGHALDYEVED